MAIADRQRLDEALDWVRRIHDPAFTEWDAHLAWLEADPANGKAFDDASLTIEDATADLSSPRPLTMSPMPTNDNMIRPPAASGRWTRWGTGLGVAVAAAVAVVIAVPSMMRGAAQPYLIQTAAGEQRSVTLDGTTIALNGDSRLRLDHANARVAVLERGEAYFIVRHDVARPFSVQAGGATFQDVGTQFDVVERADATQIAVREGAVLYDPGGASVRLNRGQTMRIADNMADVRPVDAAAVGAWRGGRLLYRDAALGDIAQDIARNIGETVLVDPALAQRRFTGVVMIDADRPLMFRRMAAVMGVDIRHAHNGWRMIMPTQ
jgi:transmembrane sensor